MSTNPADRRPTRTQAAAGHTRRPRPGEQRLHSEDIMSASGLAARRVGRSDAMLALLRAMTVHVQTADRARDLMLQEITTGSGRVIDSATVDAVAAAEAHGAFFRKLYGYGYDEESTWTELEGYLPDLVRQAREAQAPVLIESDLVNAVLAAQKMRLGEGARRFLRAAEHAIRFMGLDDTDADTE